MSEQQRMICVDNPREALVVASKAILELKFFGILALIPWRELIQTPSFGEAKNSCFLDFFSPGHKEVLTFTIKTLISNLVCEIETKVSLNRLVIWQGLFHAL